MGKYSRTYLSPQSRVPRASIHPVWRGIGCLLLVLVPIISFAAARLLVQENLKTNWIEIPVELGGSFFLPEIGMVTYAELAMMLILVIIGFGLLTVLYAVVYSLLGPPAYGPLDSPPH
jgi:hypothetical protein